MCLYQHVTRDLHSRTYVSSRNPEIHVAALVSIRLLRSLWSLAPWASVVRCDRAIVDQPAAYTPDALNPSFKTVIHVASRTKFVGLSRLITFFFSSQDSLTGVATHSYVRLHITLSCSHQMYLVYKFNILQWHHPLVYVSVHHIPNGLVAMISACH